MQVIGFANHSPKLGHPGLANGTAANFLYAALAGKKTYLMSFSISRSPLPPLRKQATGHKLLATSCLWPMASSLFFVGASIPYCTGISKYRYVTENP